MRILFLTNLDNWKHVFFLMKAQYNDEMLKETTI